MNQETRTCQNCKNDFTIEPDDFAFYEKMKVPPPEFCFECGIARIESVRNERAVYWGKCAKCGQKTMSLYHSKSPYIVYCHDCWWSDQFEGLDYGADYNPKRSIVDQVIELQRKVPREAVIILNSTNCTYGNNVRDSKNCYFSFLISNSENVLYSMWIVGSKDCMDCHKITGSELMLHSVDVLNSYHSAYIQDSSNCSDCYFSYDLRGCTNCLFCYNLRNKSYCVKNKEVGREEYLKEYQKVFNGSYATLLDSISEYEKIKEQIEGKGELSLFMTQHFSTFGYNESAAYDYYPITKEEALKQGYLWQDDVAITTGQETILTENVPDDINSVSDDFLKEIFSCINCKRNYKIVLEELKYLKRFSLPLPRECPQCRMAFRRKMRLPFKLWHRASVCVTN